MNETIDEIKSLMKSGNFAGAEALCRKVLKEAPDDAAVKMLYATCRQLLGDEESFRRIMLEITPKMEALAKADPDCEAVKLWRKSGAVLMEYVVLGVLVMAAVVGSVIIFGEQIKDRFQVMCHAYGPAPDIPLVRRQLYGSAIEIGRVIEPQATNVVESVVNETVASTNAVKRTSATNAPAGESMP